MNKDGCVQPEDTAFLCLCETEALRSADEAEQSLNLATYQKSPRNPPRIY